MPKLDRRVKLYADDVEWFESTYPGTNLSWACAMLLREFRFAQVQSPIEPAKIAAAEVKRMVDSGE